MRSMQHEAENKEQCKGKMWPRTRSSRYKELKTLTIIIKVSLASAIAVALHALLLFNNMLLCDFLFSDDNTHKAVF
jgi:hypothetical protein